MGAPRIHRKLLDEQHRRMKLFKKSARLGPSFVTVMQDQTTKAVLGVLLDRNDLERFIRKCEAEGVDPSSAEAIDFQVFV